MKKKSLKYFRPLLLFLTALLLGGCVESLTDIQTSTTPSIEIVSPKTGDSVLVGKNLVKYNASDGAGGQGLSHYELFINGVFKKKIVQNDDGTNPTIYLEIDSTLLYAKINYHLVVYNKLGKQKSSKVQENIFVKDKLPKTPSNLFLAKINETTVTLLWDDNSSNEKGFEIWRKDIGTAGTIDYRKIKTVSQNTISTTDFNVSPYITYYYKVRAYNDSGFSDFSNEANTSNLPGGSWNLKAEAIGASSVRLLWNDVAPNEHGFIIERTDPLTNDYKVLTVIGPNKTEYYDNSVRPNATYSYRVAFFTSTSKSPYSNEVTVLTYYKDFPAPANLTVSYLSGIGVQLDWTDRNKLQHQGTIVERRILGTSDFVEIGLVLPDAARFYDQFVGRGKSYIYRVRQVLDKNVYTPYSEEVRIDIPN